MQGEQHLAVSIGISLETPLGMLALGLTLEWIGNSCSLFHTVAVASLRYRCYSFDFVKASDRRYQVFP